MNTLSTNGLNRRSFLKASAAAVVFGALSSSSLGSGQVFAQSSNNQQVLDILNYALTLEHLESTAYRAALGTGLLSGSARDYFQTFGQHEASHVQTLTSVIRDLNGTPVSAQSSYNFPTFQSQQEILEFFQMVEELGAAAYLGQAPRIGGDPYLTAAVAIHNVEGQHAAVLADLTGMAPSPAFAEAKNMDQVLQVVRPLLMDQPSMPAAMPSTGRGGHSNDLARWIE